MNPVKLTSKEYFKSLQIVHFALTLGVLFFTIIATLLMIMGFESVANKEMNTTLLVVVPIFALAGIFASNFLFNTRLKQCILQTALKDKLDSYRSALIIKFALIEGPSFLSVIAYLLSGNVLFLGVIAILITILILQRPIKEKAIVELELDHATRQVIENPDGVID